MTDLATPEPAATTSRSAYISFLLKLADPSGKQKDRGALAALRRSLQDPNGIAASACPYVVPFLPADGDRFDADARVFFLVGALFALHPEHRDGVSLGDLFRAINSETAEGKQGKDNPSTRARFVALLDAHVDDVAEHVRHAVSLGRAKRLALDWDRLLRDLRAWGHPERWVQARLARDFWRPVSSESAPPETAAESEASR